MRRFTVINMEAFKRLVKIISRKVGVPHQIGLEQLSIASGYPSWTTLHREFVNSRADDSSQISFVGPRMWMEQVVQVLGPHCKGRAIGRAPFRHASASFWHASFR
jgi:hypothetical protein